MTNTATPSYRVDVQSRSVGGSLQNDVAYLEEATKNDMPSDNSPNWNCNWIEFWQKADFDCEAIIKLSFREELLGLIRFALYPFYGDITPPEYLEILHLECLPRQNRNCNPVGFWLIWYACQVSLNYCVGDDDGTLIRLDALDSAISYYENKVQMIGLGWTTYPGTGESVYAFSFTKQSAQQFCFRIEQRYGSPLQC
ncbi:MAG: hypothetical protein AAGA80_08695 [Cyanobacteria bacterium P01_F01_bin.143]